MKNDEEIRIHAKNDYAMLGLVSSAGPTDRLVSESVGPADCLGGMRVSASRRKSGQAALPLL